jgi:hypothetical protein
MSKENGFLQLRRGLWEHVRDGRMSVTEALAFIYICSEADTRTGIWKGSAKSLSNELGIPERTARDVLEKMDHGDYIRRFAVPGRHSCYPILVHKFLITDGEHRGEQLNAIESKTAVDLAYLPHEQNVEDSVEHGVEDSAAQKRKRIEKENEKKKEAKPVPPADPRFQPFLDFAFQAFKQKNGQKPTWTGKDFKALSAMLASNKSLDGGEIARRFRNYLESTEQFTRKQGDSLAYFCIHTDSFLSGPILERNKSNGNDSGKASTVETVLAGYQQLRQMRTN